MTPNGYVLWQSLRRATGCSRHAAGAILVYCSLIAPATSAPWHLSHAGQDQLVHYIHRTGHLDASLSSRAFLVGNYAVCVDLNKKRNQPIVPLDEAAIPEYPTEFDEHLYLRSDRILSEITMYEYSIAVADCSLEKKFVGTRTLESPVGSCTAGMEQKPSQPCRSLPAMSPRTNFQQLTPLNLPPSARQELPVAAHFRAEMEKFALKPDTSFPNLAAQVEQAYQHGREKTVAGLRCRMVSALIPGSFQCIARPPSLFGVPKHEGVVTGIVLQSEGLISKNLFARRIELHMPVAKDFFDVPGMEALSDPWKRR